MLTHYMQSTNQASTLKLISLWVIMGWERWEQAKAKAKDETLARDKEMGL